MQGAAGLRVRFIEHVTVWDIKQVTVAGLASQLVAPRHFEKNVKELEPAEEPAASLQLSSSDFDAMS